eukprot:CCRYP_012183-RA/>CCRYP_012183-RA protein AED:0.12 eAED:0.12 QI:194/1/1/1/1/1/2/342/231
MKFVAVAQALAVSVIFATNVCAAPEKNNLRKLSTDTSVSFLEAKPAPEECETGEKYCACRDGTQCNFTSECEDLGVGGSCDVRTPTRSNGKSCRNGDSCTDGNTACVDGSKCKVRDGASDDNGTDDYDPEDVEEQTETIDRNLEEPDAFAEAQPEQPGCRNRTLYCTCRDGSTCSRTTQCTNRGVNGSCDYRPRNRNNRKSCRNGEPCINSNTACRDGSACRIRDGIFSFE